MIDRGNVRDNGSSPAALDRVGVLEMKSKQENKESLMAGRKKKAPQAGLDVYALAREAGLGTAVNQFPADVAAAAHAAAQARSAMPDLDNVVAEPWPPMRIRKVF